MSILSNTYGNGLDNAVWDELHGEGALLKHIRSDIEQMCAGMIQTSATHATHILACKLQQYANTLYAMKDVRMWYEVNGMTIFIDVQTPQHPDKKRMIIEICT